LTGLYAYPQQENNSNTETNSAASTPINTSTENKKYSLAVGLGYFTPVLSAEGVSYPNGEYLPEYDLGVSFTLSFDYAVAKDFYIGVGYNGNYGKARFMKNVNINGEQITGYLEAGALENSSFLLNFTYFPTKKGIQPFAKLGLGYFINEVELGDVPLRLTNNVERELFPDYKSTGLGILPEIGVKYNRFTLSVAYGLPFNKLSGEEPELGGNISTGTIRSHSIQINASYRIVLF